MYVDLGAEKLLAAEKENQKIAVEVKSFIGASEMEDLEKAIGQYIVYRTVLEEKEPNRILYLAVSEDIFKEVFHEPLGKLLVEKNFVKLLSFNPKTEVITKWK